MRPTLHLTNWPSKTLHGPGRKWTIMARPRHWEHGDGVVRSLVPLEFDLLGDELTPEEYKQEYRIHLDTGLVAHILGPGELRAFTRETRWDDYCQESVDITESLSYGDTLCCSCSREKASYGECHRVWAAEALVKAGWRVVLDGEEVVG